MVVLTSPVPLHGEDARTRGRCSVFARERLSFVPDYCPSYLTRPSPGPVESSLEESKRRFGARHWDYR
jgi:hypothetical protein